MREGVPSRTALEVALRRADHQILDRPPVFDDPLATRIVGEHESLSRGPVETSARAWMAVRSRYVEDCLAKAVASGVEQYVVLGAGLDTFAYRNPYPRLRTFEVDFPATQAWKRSLLERAAIAVPPSVAYAPVDFERQTLRGGLETAGFEASRPAFFGWLGVVMYLTPEAFRATAATLGTMPEGSGVALDYMAAREGLGFCGRVAFDGLERRVGAMGEPFRLAFSPVAIADELRGVGFRTIEDLGSEGVADRYLAGRSGAFWIRKTGLASLLSAWR